MTVWTHRKWSICCHAVLMALAYTHGCRWAVCLRSVCVSLSHRYEHGMCPCPDVTVAHVQGDGSSITVEPGLIGGEINALLARHKAKGKHDIQYKIGPDPSSIDSCMIGGMVANNSSGMCCGVSQNVSHWLFPLFLWCSFLRGTLPCLHI